LEVNKIIDKLKKAKLAGIKIQEEK